MTPNIKTQRPAKTVWPDPQLWNEFRSVALRQGQPATWRALDEAIRLYVQKYKEE